MTIQSTFYGEDYRARALARAKAKLGLRTPRAPRNPPPAPKED